MSTKTKKSREKKVNTKDYSTDRFTTRKNEIKSVSTSILKLSFLYSKTKFWQRALISFIVGVAMSILSVLLAESTGLYVGGVSSFFQGTARFTRVALSVYMPNLGAENIKLVYTLMFWGQYLLLNLCLFVFAWRKIGHEFSILTLIYIAALQGFGFIFSEFVPQLEGLNILGQTATVNQQLLNHNVKSLIFFPNLFPMDAAGNYVADWTSLLSREIAVGLNPQIVNSVDAANLTRIFCLVLYASLFAVVNAICASIVFITGSSTAGSDIISVYFSQERNVPVETVMLIINIVGLLTGITLGSYVSGILVDPSKYAGFEYFLSGNLVCSFIWAILYSVVINKFFPWRKFTKVEIYTNKYEELRERMIKVNYTHPATVFSAEGGYSRAQSKVVVTICQVVEIPRLIKTIREIDQNGMITAQYINDMDGKISILKQAR